MTAIRDTLVCLALATCPAAIAQAQPVTGPYVSVGGGANFTEDQALRPNGFGPAPHNYTFDPGGAAQVAAGYGIGDGLRVEIEGDYADNHVHGVKAPVYGSRRAGGFEQQYGGFGNVLYDLPFALPVRLYVGVGPGLSGDRTRRRQCVELWCPQRLPATGGARQLRLPGHRRLRPSVALGRPVLHGRVSLHRRPFTGRLFSRQLCLRNACLLRRATRPPGRRRCDLPATLTGRARQRQQHLRQRNPVRAPLCLQCGTTAAVTHAGDGRLSRAGARPHLSRLLRLGPRHPHTPRSRHRRRSGPHLQRGSDHHGRGRWLRRYLSRPARRARPSLQSTSVSAARRLRPRRPDPRRCPGNRH